MNDESLLWIPENLSKALMRLMPKDGSRMIWADAICINQKDNSEKAWQVRQMDQVYSRADRVLIYLGEDEANSQMLQTLIPQLLLAKARVEASYSDSHNICYIMTRSQRREAGIPADDGNKYLAL